MNRITNLFSSRWGIISTGLFIGVVAALLQKLGNPGNMGVCVACFERDIAGAIGLHRADLVQYMRPEIIGFVIGALIAAYLFKEFRPRGGSSPIIRFVLGMFAMEGHAKIGRRRLECHLRHSGAWCWRGYRGAFFAERIRSRTFRKDTYNRRDHDAAHNAWSPGTDVYLSLHSRSGK